MLALPVRPYSLADLLLFGVATTQCCKQVAFEKCIYLLALSLSLFLERKHPISIPNHLRVIFCIALIEKRSYLLSRSTRQCFKERQRRFPQESLAAKVADHERDGGK